MKKITKFWLQCVVVLFFSVTTSYAQDIIVLKGKAVDEIKVKVTEVAKKTVKYKKWSYQEGPTFSLSIDDILIIKYQNGETQTFSKEKKSQGSETIRKNKYINEELNKSLESDKKKNVSNERPKAELGNTSGYQEQLQESNADNIPTKSYEATSLYSQKNSTKTKAFESAYAKGQNKFGIEAIYYSPMDKADGFNSFALEWDLTFGKYFLDKLFADVGIGVITASTSNGSAIYKIETSSTGITMPLRVGYSLPITEKIVVDLRTGPKLGYTVAGKSIFVDEVTKLRDMDGVERFSVTWGVDATVNLWGVKLGAKYMIGLTEGSGGSMWGISLGFGF